MGIDFGTKKVGIAISDDDGQMAFPREVILNNEKLISSIKDIVELEKVERIVVGESLNYKGEKNEVMKDIENFAETIKKQTNKEVVFEKEFLTTQESKHIQGANSKIDASAATIILQSYIDKLNHNGA